MLSLQKSDYLVEDFDVVTEMSRSVEGVFDSSEKDQSGRLRSLGFFSLSKDLENLTTLYGIVERVGYCGVELSIWDQFYSSFLTKREDSIVAFDGGRVAVDRNFSGDFFSLSNEQLWLGEGSFDRESFQIGKGVYRVKKVELLSKVEPELKSKLKLLISAEIISHGVRVFGLLKEYLEGRRQFGQPLSNFQVIRHMMADNLLMLEQSIALGRLVAWSYGNLREQFFEGVDSLFLFVFRSIRTLLEQGIQLFGGVGFSWEHELHRRLRRVLYLGAIQI